MKIQTLSIVAGSASCNASCPYCVSKMTGKELSFKEPFINWRNFEKSCQYARLNDVSTVMITGKGEPTLFPEQISKFLIKLKEFNFPFIDLQTNGLLFLQKRFDKFLKQWYELGLTTIAVSVVHYKKEKNKEIFTPNSEYPDLKELVDKLHSFGFTVRFSCTMIKGYVDNFEETENMINKVHEWKVEQLSLRELAVPKKAVCREVYEWSIKHMPTKDDYKKIKEFVVSHGNKLLELSHESVVYDVSGQNVCLTNALTIEPENTELRQIIFFPDGHLRYDWQYKGAIII